VLAIGGDGSSSIGCVDVGGNSCLKCVSLAQQWKISSTPLYAPFVDPKARAVAPPQMQLVPSVLVEVDGSASGIVGLLGVISAAEDIAAVGVGLDTSGVAGYLYKCHVGN
jgi:hypothetical protein